MTVYAFVFPGQGSQQVGMGKELFSAFSSARDVFEEVDHALDQNLSRLMFEGPLDELTLTQNAQPALMAVSIAVMRVLEKECGIKLSDYAQCVAGHSLGEYSALCAAGTFSLADAARLLRIRGNAMQRAVPVGIGAMAAMRGMGYDEVVRLAQEASRAEEICNAANDNSSEQVVISGHAAAVERAMTLAIERGAKKPILLPVSAPFHCQLMQPAAEAMEDALAEVSMHAPCVPIITNVTATPSRDIEEIRKRLVDQVCGTVRWRESVLMMKSNNVDTLVECGVGKVLAGLAKKIDPDLNACSLHTPADIETFARSLK